MKNKLLLMSHSHMASGLHDTLRFFLGDLEHVSSVDAYLDESDRHVKVFQEFIDNLKDDEVGVVFTDLMGGSVNQYVMKEVVDQKLTNVLVCSNMNLAVVLTAALEQETLTAQRMKEIIQEAQVAMPALSCDCNENEEAFF